MSAQSLDTVFEAALERRMKACAVELDRTVNQAPPLRTLLAHQRQTRRPIGRISVRVGLVVGAGVLAIALVLGLPLLQSHESSGALSSLTPPSLATPPVSPSASPSFLTPSPSLAEPSLSPAPSPSLASAAGLVS
jgi:hypothetical protein